MKTFAGTFAGYVAGWLCGVFVLMPLARKTPVYNAAYEKLAQEIATALKKV